VEPGDRCRSGPEFDKPLIHHTSRGLHFQSPFDELSHQSRSFVVVVGQTKPQDPVADEISLSGNLVATYTRSIDKRNA
jgi:hypothetical protein